MARAVAINLGLVTEVSVFFDCGFSVLGYMVLEGEAVHWRASARDEGFNVIWMNRIEMSEFME